MADKYTGLFDDLAPASPTVPGGTVDKYTGLFDGLEPKATSDSAGQERGVMRLPKILGHALAGGTMSMIGLPGGLSEAAKSASGMREFKPRNALEAGLQKTSEALSLPTAENISAGITKLGKLFDSDFKGLGLDKRPELKPETAVERYGAAITGALPAVPLAMVGGVGVLPALAITEAGALSAQAAADVAPGNKWLPVVAGIAGSMAAGGLVSWVQKGLKTNAAWERLGKAEKALDDALDASFALKDPAGRVSVKTTTARNALEAAQDTALASREQTAKNALAVQKAAEAKLVATQKATDDMVAAVTAESTKTVDDLAAGLGQSTTLQKAGEQLQEAARHWKTKVFPKKLEDVSKPLAAAIPGDTHTPLFGFSKALDEITGSGGKLATLRAELVPKLPARLKHVLDEVLDSPAGINPTAAKPQFSKTLVDDLGNPLQTGTVLAKPGQPVTWDEVRELRSALGDALGNPKIVHEVGEQNLRHLYATVTGDLRSAAKDYGDEALKLFDEYNRVSTDLYNVAGGVMSRIINSTNKALESVKPGKVVESLLSEGKVDATDLALLRSELPKALDDVGAVALRHGQFESLSPEAKIALFGTKAPKIEQAITNRVQAAENAKTVMTQTKAEVDQLKAAARDAEVTGKFDQLRALRAAQKAKRAEDAANAKAAAQAAGTRAKQSYESSKQVRGARKELKAAKEDIPPPVHPNAQLANALTRMTSGGAAYAAAVPILNALHLPTGPGAQAAIGAAGLALPALWRAAKATVKDPKRLAIPAAGAVVGQNALAPQQAK